MSKSRNAEEFARHLTAESTFASAALSRLAPLASMLAAEARRYAPPAGCGSSSSSSLDDSVPERIGDYLYFTRTGGGGPSDSCSLLRRRVCSVGAESELVVDVAAVAASQGARSLGQLKLSPCGRAVAMTLDVGGGGKGGGGGECWRAVVVEAGGGGGGGGGGGNVLGSVDGVTSVEWGAAPPPRPSPSSSSPSPSSLLSLPALFYTRGGAGGAGCGGGPATLHHAPWDEAARRFLLDEGKDSSSPPLFSEPDPSRVLALGRSKDGALLTLASAAAGGSVAYALWLRGGGGAAPFSPSPPSPSAASTSTTSTSTSLLPPSPSPSLICVAPFEEGVEHYLEHCAGVPGGLVVMTTAARRAGGGEETGEFWLAAPLAGGDAGAPPPSPPSSPRPSIPAPSAWRALLPPARSGDGDEAAAVLTDIDVYRESVLCYERCSSTGRPRLSLLRDLGGRGGGGGGEVKAIALPSPDLLVVRPGANADPAAETARVTLSGPLSPPRDLDLCLETGEWLLSSAPSPPPPAPGGGGGGSDCGLEVASERSPGGVPVTLVRRRTKRSSTREEEEQEQEPRPVLLALYGCYGLPLDPGFDPVALALARSRKGGFDLAFAHLRGGGELGRRWHAAGRGENRARVAEDAREVVTWLSSGNGSGSGSGSGGSEGDGSGNGGGGGRGGDKNLGRRPVALVAESAGALVAGALLADPGVAPLLSAVSLRVPFVDVLAGIAEEEDGGEEEDGEGGEEGERQRRLCAHERGEFSSSSSSPAAAASALAAVCPYHLLSEFERNKATTSGRLPGPPVLVVLAEDDARVPAAGVAKWVARLRRLRGGASAGGGGGGGSGANEVLLDVMRGCGHAEGLRSEGDIEANAREAAFLVDATEKWLKRENLTKT
jgi:hypothetical protein